MPRGGHSKGGRKPKPPALKEAMGNPGNRPIPEVELPETGSAEMPAFLRRNKRAVQLWEEYAPTLAVLGTLKAESAHMFAAWCALTAELERNPKEFNASRYAQWRALASSLGMDPSAQGKFIGKPKSDGDEDPAAEFFTGPRLASG